MDVSISVLILCVLVTGTLSCTFTSKLVGTWKSSNYGLITITSTQVKLATIPFFLSGINTNILFTCYENSATNTYVVQSDTEVTALGSKGRAYICFEFTQVNDNSVYFYMKSQMNNIFGNERVGFWANGTTPKECLITPPKAEFTSMVKNETAATTYCMNSLLGNFYYKMTTTSGSTPCTGTSKSLLTVCNGRQNMVFNISLCAGTNPVMFSATGTLGCLSVIQDGSTYYSGLYNYDTTPNGFTTYQFTCIMVTTNGSTINVNAKPKRCDSTQSTSTRQSGEELYAMTAYETCPFTSSSFDPLPIILGVIFGLLLIILLAILIYYCCKKKKKRDKIKQQIHRNLMVFEKKMAMDEFDDEHPLNEASLVPDFPQNGYPEPLKLSLRGKKYSMPKVTDVEIQTDRSSFTDREFGPSSNSRVFGPQKDFNNSSRSLNTQKDFESQTDMSFNQPSSVHTHNNPMQNRLKLNKPQPEFPSEPQYLPWPWRTANRAMKTSTQSVKSGTTSFRSTNLDLGEFTIKNYGIKYDDTLSSVNTHPPPRRPLSRSNSVYDLSRPPTRMLEMKKAYSHESLNRSQTSMAHYPTYPTPNTLLQRSVSHNDISRTKSKSKPFPNNQFLRKPPSMPNAPSRRASVSSVKSMLRRSNLRMLKTISESKERIPTPLKIKRKPPIPTYMRPLTRSKTAIPTLSALRKAAIVYGKRPSTEKLSENSRSLLQTKLRQYKEEKPRKKRKKLRKRKSMWRSPFSLPSSIQPRPLSLRAFSNMKKSKVAPTKKSATTRSNKTSARLNDSLTDREFTTTDDITSDSNGENFLDAETLHVPRLEEKQNVAAQPSKREQTFRMDKKVSEDSGISADESPTDKPPENDDDMMFRVAEIFDKGKFKVVTPRSFATPKKKILNGISDSGISADDSASSKDSENDTRFPLPDIIETSHEIKPGQLKPPPRRKNPWK